MQVDLSDSLSCQTTILYSHTVILFQRRLDQLRRMKKVKILLLEEIICVSDCSFGYDENVAWGHWFQID